ncbi:hypothetical protein ACFTAO_46250 [Paenibacillus rhizoplanae]
MTQFKTDAGSVSVRNLWEHGGRVPERGEGLLIFLPDGGVRLCRRGIGGGYRQRRRLIRRKKHPVRDQQKFRCGFCSSM